MRAEYADPESRARVTRVWIPGSREDARPGIANGDSGAEDVVGFKRLVDLGKPFGTVGGAAAAAFVERQFQLAQQARDFLTRGDMPHARPGAKRRLVELVE